MLAYCNNNPVNAIDSNGRSALAIGLFIGGSAIIGGLAGAFTAACTGGNVWEGAIEGAALGATAATATVLAPALLPAAASGLAVGATAFALSSLGGIIIDYTTQRVSHRITTGSDDGFILDVGRLLKTGFTTGVSGVLPTYGKPQETAINAVGSLVIGGDASLINSAVEIIITKILDKLGGK